MQGTIRILMAAAATIAIGAASAPAADLTLTAGKVAKLIDKSGTAKDQAIVKFVKDPVLSGVLPGPLCPTVTTVRLRTDTGDHLVTLDCTKWTLTGSGYSYKDKTGAQGGVQKIKLSTKPTGGKLLIKVKGDQYGINALAGPVAFLEAELRIGDTAFCGRFEAPTATFKKNVTEKIIAKGPSIACVAPPTPTGTVTNTASVTPTPTITRTPSNTPTASQTMTPSNTPTVTHTGTATWTASHTFTPAPTSTATHTGTVTSTPTITLTPTPTFTGLPTATVTETFTPTVTPVIEPSVFRIDSIALRDPHVFVSLIGCTDATNPPGILGLSANGEIANALNADDDMDGFLDINILAIFRPLEQPPQPGAMVELTTGECTVPLGSETCGPGDSTGGSTTYANQSAGICLTPLAGTTGPNNSGNYSPIMTQSSAPCFSTDAVDVEFPFGLFTIPLEDVRGSATYVGDPALQMIDGLIYGFLSEAAADSILLPADLPLIGGQPLSGFLAGGSGACPGHTAKDIGPGGEPGWYFYLNFTAHKVAWTGD